RFGGAPAVRMVGSALRRNTLSSKPDHVVRVAPQGSSRARGRARSRRGGGRRVRYPIGFRPARILISRAAFAGMQPSDCARAAKHSESRRGSAILVMQNGRTIFEHYANGGSASRRWPIFSGTKSFWGIAALAAVHDGLFSLEDPVSDTITEWKSNPRK